VKNPYSSVLYRTADLWHIFRGSLELVLTVLGRTGHTAEARFSRLSLGTVFEEECAGRVR
jgi:hypothetical protein